MNSSKVIPVLPDKNFISMNMSFKMDTFLMRQFEIKIPFHRTEQTKDIFYMKAVQTESFHSSEWNADIQIVQ